MKRSRNASAANRSCLTVRRPFLPVTVISLFFSAILLSLISNSFILMKDKTGNSLQRLFPVLQ